MPTRSLSGFGSLVGVVSLICDAVSPVATLFMPRTIEGGSLRGLGSSGVLVMIAPDPTGPIAMLVSLTSTPQDRFSYLPGSNLIY